MFLSISLYFIILVLIWWAYCGYLFILYLLSLFNGRGHADAQPDDNLDVAILVPCYNEAALALQKLANIRALDYPKDRLKVLFLDGTSTDDTVAILEGAIKEDEHIRVVRTGVGGKINQLNSVLESIDADIVMNTDMDAELNPDVLKKMVREFNASPDTRLIGASVFPSNCNVIDEQYWETQNWFRVMESRVISSSIVVAPCYAFRRSLLKRFPEDCVADDIYISFLNNTQGGRTVYLEGAVAFEGRNPLTIEGLVTHKFRKANAYITELLRFLYLLPRMNGKWKMIYLTKLLQVVVMPWVLIFFALGSASFILTSSGTLKIVAFAFAFLFVSLLACHVLVKKNVRSVNNRKYKKRLSISIFMVANLVLFLAGITYPFYVQSSNYKKVG